MPKLTPEIREDLAAIAERARAIPLSPFAGDPSHTQVENLTAEYGISSVYADSFVLQGERAVLLVGTAGSGKTTTQAALVAELEGSRVNYNDIASLRYREDSGLQLFTFSSVPSDSQNIPKDNIQLLSYVEGVAPIVLVVFFDDSGCVEGSTYEAHEVSVSDRMIGDYMLDGPQFDGCREAVAARLRDAFQLIPCLSIEFNYEEGEYLELDTIVDLIKRKIANL